MAKPKVKEIYVTEDGRKFVVCPSCREPVKTCSVCDSGLELEENLYLQQNTFTLAMIDLYKAAMSVWTWYGKHKEFGRFFASILFRESTILGLTLAEIEAAKSLCNPLRFLSERGGNIPELVQNRIEEMLKKHPPYIRPLGDNLD
jgi:predicted amidophosphoribosyltransferase